MRPQPERTVQDAASKRSIHPRPPLQTKIDTAYGSGRHVQLRAAGDELALLGLLAGDALMLVPTARSAPSFRIRR